MDAYKFFNRKNRKTLTVMFSIRGLANAVLAGAGATLAFSTTGPLFEYLGKKYAANRAVQSAFFRLASMAGVAAGRAVLLLRVIACTTWVGIGVTIIIFAITDDELEDWCQQSSFRKNPKSGDDRFKDETEELTKLYQAFTEVG